jgi:hypothetical protein
MTEEENANRMINEDQAIATSWSNDNVETITQVRDILKNIDEKIRNDI